MERIQIENIGWVSLKWGNRYKSIKLKVSVKEGIVLTFPRENDRTKALELLFQHQDWLKKTAQKAKNEFEKYLFNEKEIIHSKYRKIELKRHSSSEIKLHADQNSGAIFLPENANIRTASTQESIRKMFEVILKNEAEYFILPKAKQIALKHNIKVKSFSIRPSRTRWGSCSAINAITFSSYLVLLPERLVDYVIYHELAHVQEKHHQKSFWAHLCSLLPNALQLDAEMQIHRTMYLNKINMD